MKKFAGGLFLSSMSVLITELSLIRVFDVLFYPNIAYMIITSALFGFGLAGVYTVLRPGSEATSLDTTISRLAVIQALSTLAILPVMNLLPFDFNELANDPILQTIYFVGIYLILILPFFFAGLILANIFSALVNKAQFLYFSDLIGAAIGSIFIIPLTPVIGPGGLLFCAAAFSLIASAFFSRIKIWSIMASTLAIVVLIIPFMFSPDYIDFKAHQDKRGIESARQENRIEYTVWDPISKIDVIDFGWMRKIAYDGGSQESSFFPFDGNFQSLRANLANEVNQPFWQRGTLASHFLQRDTGANVLVIGSAGGQEIKGALTYGANHVTGVELVGSVVELGNGDYSSYIGELFHHPDVDLVVGEGRSYLRSTIDKYDVIQIFSNHTSSSVASGTGALQTTYLQTSEAYKEYFTHLTDNGILHINHHGYPKMITTASLAWAELGRDDFQGHVVVFTRSEDDTLPTFLVKMQPWTTAEMEELEEFFSTELTWDNNTYFLAENPLNPEESWIGSDYFQADYLIGLGSNADFSIRPATDNRPFFNFFRDNIFLTTADFKYFTGGSLDSLPLVSTALTVTSLVSIFYGLAFILLPLIFSRAVKLSWGGKKYVLTYFSCLGASFIIIEFVFIQVFMHLIGSPLYTFSTVIFVILLGAGVGSYISEKVKISPEKGWYIPFGGIVIVCLLILLGRNFIFPYFLGSPIPIRILVACLLLFPQGVFLGMPFPLGLLALKNQPKGAIAWAWGMNGLFTVIGSLLGVVFSIKFGFNNTLFIALCVYFLAFCMFWQMRQKLA